MKTALKTISLILLLASCSDKGKEILGVWDLDSKFYSATYKIEKTNNKLKAQILYYNDGTTQYKFNKNDVEKVYSFQNLKHNNGIYVDAVSGATKKTNPEQAQIKAINKDTLTVTTYVFHKPLTEKWIRKKSH